MVNNSSELRLFKSDLGAFSVHIRSISSYRISIERLSFLLLTYNVVEIPMSPLGGVIFLYNNIPKRLIKMSFDLVDQSICSSELGSQDRLERLYCN
jgi:hypothetical protein